jgi:hypothetical protein
MYTNSVHSKSPTVNSLPMDSTNFNVKPLLQHLPKLEEHKAVIDSYAELLIGSSHAEKNDVVGNWIYQTFLLTALGFNSSEKQQKAKLINSDALIRNFGIDNAFCLVIHSYRMAHQIAGLQGEYQEEALISIEFFHKLIQDMAKAYPAAYKKFLNELKSGKEPTLNRGEIRHDLVAELKKEARNSLITKIAVITIGFITLTSIVAYQWNSFSTNTQPNREAEVPSSTPDSAPTPIPNFDSNLATVPTFDSGLTPVPSLTPDSIPVSTPTSSVRCTTVRSSIFTPTSRVRCTTVRTPVRTLKRPSKTQSSQSSVTASSKTASITSKRFTNQPLSNVEQDNPFPLELITYKDELKFLNNIVETSVKYFNDLADRCINSIPLSW